LICVKKSDEPAYTVRRRKDIAWIDPLPEEFQCCVVGLLLKRRKYGVRADGVMKVTNENVKMFKQF
jgi:hypothetical protein